MTGFNFSWQVAVGGRNDADIYFDGFGIPHFDKLTGLQHP